MFGHGDGGGGPTAEMLELARRAGDLQGVPRVQLAPTSEFFDRLEEDLGEPRAIEGELYFEYHRGTYTSQARTKRGNRAGERLLHEAEAAAAIAHRLGRADYPARGAARALADRCCSTSSTTSSPAARSARSTRTPSATTRASPPARPSCATRRSPRSATASPRR